MGRINIDIMANVEKDYSCMSRIDETIGRHHMALKKSGLVKQGMALI